VFLISDGRAFILVDRPPRTDHFSGESIPVFLLDIHSSGFRPVLIRGGAAMLFESACRRRFQRTEDKSIQGLQGIGSAGGDE
jgi:hypothetical protein